MNDVKFDEEAVFQVARKIEQPEARAAYLRELCGSDRDLQVRLEALLRVHDQEPSFLAVSPVDVTVDSPQVAELSGTVIGPYKLLEQIGEGGMGTVFMAEQTHPVRRKVALKVIKPGMDSRQVVARFEAERQALALMDHPNIAKVHDAGTTNAGLPYFVMELVRGIPITDYCDKARLSIPERLDLFVLVCRAVQHAHQKGIIHRDLKPSNVLVTLIDGAAVPKVIDFGVAKATGAALTDRSLFTGFAQMIGTPLYMSPEQAELSGVDVDTRSDVYALGVLLYELLTGTTPIDREALGKAAYDEIRRIIREQETPTPSTRLGSLGATLDSVSANRQADARTLGHAVRGELDWIVMKALEKDRTRRYETANDLAADVMRHLADQPVEACPPSPGYKLKKYARKHRRLLSTAVAFLVLLVLGVVVSTWQAVRATAAAKAEGQANERAQQSLVQVEKANEILGSIFKDLDPGAEEKEGKPLRVLLGERLDRATRELEGEAVGDPLTVAKLQMTLGSSQRALGYPEKAIALFTRARATYTSMLGPEHLDTLNSMGELASAYKIAMKPDLALPLSQETLRRVKAKLGPEHVHTLNSMNNLAGAYASAGKLDLALPLLEETVRLKKVVLGPEAPDTLASMSNLGELYRSNGKLGSALPLLERTLELQKARLGPDHWNTLASMSNLSHAFYDSGKLDQALHLFEETTRLTKTKLGPDHPKTLSSMSGLAQAYRDSGKLDQALPLFEESTRLSRAKLGSEDPRTLACMNCLALAYRETGKLDQAMPLLEEALRLYTAKLGPDHPATLINMSNLASVYQDLGRFDEAVALNENMCMLFKAKLGPEHPNTLNGMNNLAVTYWNAGKLEKGLPLLEETFKLIKAKLGPEHSRSLIAMSTLAGMYAEAHNHAEAVRLAEELVAIRRRKLPADELGLAKILARLGRNLLLARQPTEAQSSLRECLAIRERKEPDSWATFEAKSLLGGALLGQENYAEAEPLLLEGYEGMKQREARMTVPERRRLTEAAELLVRLYEAINQPKQAAVWREEARPKPVSGTSKDSKSNEPTDGPSRPRS